MRKSAEGSTARLLRLCAGYFFFYVVTGVTVKYFQGDAARGYPGMSGLEFLAWSTLGGTTLCLVGAVALRWYRMESNELVPFLGLRVPTELRYIVPSGVCTAVVIPTTTLLYSFPFSVMVAMVVMRGSVIVLSRAIDAVQIRQGILEKRVYLEEDLAVGFALAAIGIHLVGTEGAGALARSGAALAVLGSYVVAYAVRLYIMNWFKNTRADGVRQDDRGFFALEQIAASVTLAVAAVLVLAGPIEVDPARALRAALADPKPEWPLAILAGTAFGAVAFFSVFLFLLRGRTATFAGLVNRLTSLVAGTTATLLTWALFEGRFPERADWISLALILVAVGFLAKAERRRAAELA